MGRFVADQNQQVMFYESGTYANTSGPAVWIGQIQTFDSADNPNVKPIRYQGAGDRSVQTFVDGPLDYTGKINFYPQDFKTLAFALGSCVDAGSPAPSTHTMSEANTTTGNAFTSGTTTPFISFGLEEAQRQAVTGGNKIVKYTGVMIDTWKLQGAMGGILTNEVDWLAQAGTFTSGTGASVTADTNRPYLWDDVQFHLPSGTVLNELKDFTFTLANNIDAPHYLNGSRQIGLPTPLARNYTMEITIDNSNTWAKPLYDQYYIGGSTFNSLLWVNKIGTTGSYSLSITMSGCKITKMSDPDKTEGLVENKVTFQPKNCNAVATDQTLKYNPW